MANRVVVIGAGASGLTAAIFAAEGGAQVTLLEHKDRVGKKILMTGNGKCNLTNMSDVHGRYHSNDESSLQQAYDVLARFGASETRAFFARLGLYTREKKDGCVYPVSEQASIVLDVLRSASSRLGVRTLTDCAAVSIVPGRAGGNVQVKHKADGKKGSVPYDRLILAAGGKAAPSSGSDGSGYELAKKLGHSIIGPFPALVQLQCAGGYFKSIAGVRAQSRLELYLDGRLAASEEGELQITDRGISGIPVFQFSGLAARGLHDGRKCEVRIDLVPYLSDVEQAVRGMDLERHRDKTVEELLAGMVHKKLASLICRQQDIASGMTVGQAGQERVRRCIQQLSGLMVSVTGTNPFENAQVCSGGVPLREVDRDLRSCRHSDVHIVGELLDCDGICGGYNLQWAWATGAIAGTAAAKTKEHL